MNVAAVASFISWDIFIRIGRVKHKRECIQHKEINKSIYLHSAVFINQLFSHLTLHVRVCIYVQCSIDFDLFSFVLFSLKIKQYSNTNNVCESHIRIVLTLM